MCLSIYVGYQALEIDVIDLAKQHVQRATQDITVYKRLDVSVHKRKKFYRSPTRGFKWERGYHYYQTGRTIGQKFGIERWYGKLEIYRGLHSYRTKTIANTRWSRCQTVKMIIPKGALYFLNGDEYCSDQLIFPKQ